MYWILRRTGAANFFNSLNNNCSSSKDNGGRYNANGTQDKYVKRPPRKAYGRLSAGDDDAISLELKIDEPFDDLDNFELIGGHNRTGNKNTQNGNCVESKALTPLANQMDSFGNLKEVQCTPTDCQKNFVAESDLCDLNLCNNNGTGSIFPMNSSTAIERRQKELDKNTINRLHMMAMSDNDDYDESLTCNVCDRSFHCHRQLASHQQKKRHFGCSGCDSLFPSLMLLEHHKEEFEHWSDDESGRRNCCRRNQDDYFTDTDSYTSEAESEDLERLL